MELSEYTRLDATALAKLITEGEVSSTEVQEAGYRAVAGIGAKLNAVADGPWWVPTTYARHGRFAGVPMAIKDLGCAAIGVPSRNGSYLGGEGVIPDVDSHLMLKFRAAGLAGIAVSTSDELGFGANTDSRRFGRTINPWSSDRSPGGSSGGSAALVAAGAVPIAHASDSGGSIRIPAAVNGLVGLKPSRGRIPQGPAEQEGFWGFSSEFVLTRSVRDCAAVLDDVSGAMPGDKTIVSPPEKSWSDEVRSTEPRLRVGVFTESWNGAPIDSAVTSAVERTGRVLEDLGHLVEYPSFRFDWESMLRAMQILGCTSAAIGINRIERQTGNKASEENVQPILISYRDYGQRFGAIDIGNALETVNEVSRTFGELFRKYSVLLLPNMNVVSWRADELDANDPPVDALEWMRKMFGVFSFAPVFNMTGTPALTLPLAQSRYGEPIGVQLASGMCDEMTLFRVARELERAMPWFDRRPRRHAAEEY